MERYFLSITRQGQGIRDAVMAPGEFGNFVKVDDVKILLENLLSTVGDKSLTKDKLEKYLSEL